MNRVILHSDMDNFFAAVEEKHNPKLRNIPFVVCGDPQMRHSVVMSKNALAKRVGIKTGISYAQAKQICPNLGYVTADMHKYLAESKLGRNVYRKYTDNIIPYGLDEAWVVFDNGVTVDEATQIADVIRIETKYSLGLSTSIGVSYNFVFSKLGSDYNKPNGTTVITKDNYKQIVWNLPASELLFVGTVRKKMLSRMGINTIGDIAKADPDVLGHFLGKVGYDLWSFANGDDRNFQPDIDKIGSIGNTVTPPANLNNNDEASAVIYMLATAIATRLQKHRLKARCISVTTRDSKFAKVIRQCTMSHPTDNRNRIFNGAFRLFQTNYKWDNPLRSIGVRVDNLDYDLQLSLFDDDCSIIVDIDSRVKTLIKKFGKLKFEQSAASREWEEECAEDTVV